MGTYSTQEFIDTFGGLPEPGETYPDDPDAVRDECEHADGSRDTEPEPPAECSAEGADRVVCAGREACPGCLERAQ